MRSRPRTSRCIKYLGLLVPIACLLISYPLIAQDLAPANQVGLDITMSKANYPVGDQVTASEFRVRNSTTIQQRIEIKVWLEIPGLSPTSILNIGSDGTFSLPASVNVNLGPVTLMSVTSATTRGTYSFSSRVVDPTTGELQGEDLNDFTIGVPSDPEYFDRALEGARAYDIRQIVEAYTNPAMRDSSMGTRLGFSTFSTNFIPAIEITMSKSSYSQGDSVTAAVFRIRNSGSESGMAELKVWLSTPNSIPTSILNVGGDLSLTFPANLDVNLGPVSLFNVQTSTTRGNYELSSRVLDPVTGRQLSVRLNPFTIL